MTTALRTTLLFAAWLAAANAWAQVPGTDQRVLQAEQQLRQAELIATIESLHGAYSDQLAEPLLGMGRMLQEQGRHEEALAMFKRGIHLVRINDGLNSAAQIPLLEGEIRSYIASGDYAMADQRQSYLYRVQTRNQDRMGDLTKAFMRQAQWQFDAFLLALEDQGYSRLVRMDELYSSARDSVILRDGEHSSRLLQPLLGKLQTQYLIASYRGAAGVTSANSAAQSRDRFRFGQMQNRTDVEVRQTLAQLGALDQRSADPALWRAQADVMLADWLMWSGANQEAIVTYERTLAELGGGDDAQPVKHGILDEPVALPNLEGLRWLPEQVETMGPETVQVSFDVTAGGRVINLERVDENDELDGRANTLMRKLRRTTFRPRFEGGQAVETKDLVRIYKLSS